LVAVEQQERVFFTRHGQRVYSEPCGRSAGYDVPHYSIHHAELHRVLLEAVEAQATGRPRAPRAALARRLRRGGMLHPAVPIAPRALRPGRARPAAGPRARLDGRLGPPGGGRKLLFDQAPSSAATPDIVVRSAGSLSNYPALLEVKYKPAEGDPDRDAINQAITYAASYRCDHVAVIQPRASATGAAGLKTLGTLGDITFYQYIFDMDADNLTSEEAAFGKAVRALARLAE
jgi:hypothetical protein